MKYIFSSLLCLTILFSCKENNSNNSDDKSAFNDIYEFNDFLIDKVNEMEASIDIVFNYMDNDDRNEVDLIALIDDSKKTNENIISDLNKTNAYGEGGDDFLKATISYINAVGDLIVFMNEHTELFLISDEDWDEDAIEPTVNDEFDRILEQYEIAFEEMEKFQEIYATKNETTVEN